MNLRHLNARLVDSGFSGASMDLSLDEIRAIMVKPPTTKVVGFQGFNPQIVLPLYGLNSVFGCLTQPKPHSA